MAKVLVIGGVIASLIATPAPPASASPSEVPTEKIAISVAAINGSGCPAGTTSVAATDDNTAFTVTYRAFLAQAGGGADVTDSRRNCQLNLQITVPAGYRYAIARAEHRGFAHLAPGATGQQNAYYYFAGMAQTAEVSHSFTGPLDDHWSTIDGVALNPLGWSPCGQQRNLNVNTELRVNAGTAAPKSAKSLLSMAQTDGSIHTTYHLSWQSCS